MRKGKRDSSTSATSAKAGDLHALCRKGDVEAVRLLLSSGPGHVDSRAGNLGLTPLHEACSNNHPEVCFWLLRYGVEVNRTTIEGKYTALHLATFYRHHRCVETLLVEKGRNLNLSAVNADGKTALQLAQAKGYRDIVRLIRSGEVSQVAENEHAADRIRYLLEKLQLQEMADDSCAPATEKVVTKLLETALRKAAKHNNIQAIGYLLQFGSCKAEFIFDCFRDAFRSNHHKVAIMLLLAYTALEGETEQARFLLAKENVDIGVGNMRNRELVQRYREVLEQQLSIAVRVALQNNKIETAGELLFNMDCNEKTGKIEWFGLGLHCLPDQWLVRSSPNDSIHKSPNCLWVTSLNISSNFLSTIPPVVKRLQNLCKLDLSRNYLGSQDEGNRLSVEIFALPNLKTINLSQAELRTFPEVPDWSQALTSIDLSGNSLRDLPGSFGNAVSLDRLYLASNQLREVPVCIGSLINLRTLDLSENLAITRLPNIMGNLAQLIDLKVHNLDISYPPDNVLDKAPSIVRFLRKQLRDLRPVRAAKVVVVGSSNPCRCQLVDIVQQNKDCSMTVLDLGNLPLFSKFLEALKQVAHTHYLIVWDVKQKESVKEVVGYLELIRRLLKDRALAGKGRRQQLDVLVVPLFKGEPDRDELKWISDELEKAPELQQLSPVAVQVKNVATEASGFYSVGELLKKLEQLRDDFLVMKDVPQTHCTVEKCFQRNKRQLSRPLNETAWTMNREDLWEQVDRLVGHEKNDIPRDNWQEMEKLLSFLQATGQIMQLGGCGGCLHDTYFVTPQWVFHSLQATFGPPNCAEIPRQAFCLPGLLRRAFLNDRAMFGSKPRAPLRKHAVELGEHFSLAFPVAKDFLYVPLQTPTECAHHDEVVELITTGNLLYRFLVPASVRLKQNWSASSFWDKLIAHILCSMPVIFTPQTGPEDYTSSVKKLLGQDGTVNIPSLGSLLASLDCTLSLWHHGVACWHGNKLDLAVFRLSTLAGCFRGFAKDRKETLCVVVPNDGRTGVSRLATLLEMVFCLVEDVFNEDWQELEQLVPCPYCMTEGSHAENCFGVGKCLQLFTQGKTFSGYLTCPRHTSVTLTPEQLIPDMLLEDVDARFRFSHSELQYEANDQIGAGGFGKVFIGLCEDQKAAFKESKLQQTEHVTQVMRTFREVRQECQVLKVFAMYHKLSDQQASPFFARCYGVCLRPLVLVSEYAQFKSLDAIIKESPHILSHLFIVIVAMEIITAIKALHKMRVVYRDMKAGNVLVFATTLQGNTPHVKLADFGTAVLLPPGQLVKVVGTPAYQAPEMLSKDSSYSLAVDVYAFGLLVYELIARDQAFSNVVGPVGQAIRQGLHPHLHVLRFGCQLLRKVWHKCCEQKPQDRPPAAHVQQHLMRIEAQLLLHRFTTCDERSVSFVKAFVNTENQPLLLVISRGRESSLIHLTPLIREKSDEKDSLLPVIMEAPLPNNRVTCACIVVASQSLWLGTQHCRLIILGLADLSPGEGQIPLPDIPVAIVANAYHVFIALANGVILTYPCRPPDSTMPGSRSRYCVQHDVYHDSQFAAMLLVNQHLWCMSSDQKVIVFLATSPPEPLRSYQGSVGRSSMPAQALRLAYSPDTNQVWALFRQSSVLIAWDASSEMQSENKVMVHDVRYDMRTDWVHTIDDARQYIHGDLLHPELRPRNLIICRDVLWVSTSCGIILLYHIRRSADPQLIRWFFPHTVQVGSLNVTSVESTEGYSGPIVISAGVGCPLYDKNSCFSLSRPDVQENNDHVDGASGIAENLWEDYGVRAAGSPLPMVVQTPSQADHVAVAAARSGRKAQSTKRHSRNRLSADPTEPPACPPATFTVPGDASIAAMDLVPVEQSNSPMPTEANSGHNLSGCLGNSDGLHLYTGPLSVNSDYDSMVQEGKSPSSLRLPSEENRNPPKISSLSPTPRSIVPNSPTFKQNVQISKSPTPSETTAAESVPKLNIPIPSVDQRARATNLATPTPPPSPEAVVPDVANLDSCILFWQGTSAEEIQLLSAASKRCLAT